MLKNICAEEIQLLDRDEDLKLCCPMVLMCFSQSSLKTIGSMVGSGELVIESV